MRIKILSNVRRTSFFYFPLFITILLTSFHTHLIYAQNSERAKSLPPRETKYPVTNIPSQITLNLTNSPSTSISISWSTSTDITHSVVEWREAHGSNPQLNTIKAKSVLISDQLLINNPEILRWYVTLNNLTPNTQYEYRVGSPENNLWSNWFKFKTAPEDPQRFSFIYLGDAQNGFEQWGKILKEALKKCPECSFVMIAGDLVNRGNERDDWDDFFYNADNVFAEYPLVPTVGNHEYKSSTNMTPKMYLDYFVLPENGPTNITPELCYSFSYSNSKFIILNGNLNPLLQVEWLEEQLKDESGVWKFLMFHQPIYSSAPRRDNKHLRDAWLPLIDKYHVDVVFQGHDHSYWRTHPLKNGEIVSAPNEGTIFIISYSGTKGYEQQEPSSIIAKAFSKTPTYQIITIETQPEDRLTYHSYDLEGNLRDEFSITKSKKLSWNFEILFGVQKYRNLLVSEITLAKSR